MVMVLDVQLLLVLLPLLLLLVLLLMVMVSRVLRADPLDRTLLLLLLEKRVRAEVSRLVRLRGRRRSLVRDRRQVFGHGVLEFFHGVRVALRGPLVAAAASGFRRTGW